MWSQRRLYRTGKAARFPRSQSDFTLTREIQEYFTTEVSYLLTLFNICNQSFPHVQLGSRISSKRKKPSQNYYMKSGSDTSHYDRKAPYSRAFHVSSENTFY